MSETAVATPVQPGQTKAVVQWKGEPLTITFQDVKSLICPLATDQEVAIFLKTCQSLQLNPFAHECFLIKYDSRDKAAFVIAIDSYLKAAEANPEYDGCEAGIVLKDSGGKLELREGAFLLDEDRSRLAGGWAKVYRKDRSRPTYVAVNKNECIKLTREGKPTQFWSEFKQPWMLRKSALKRALVEAFPSLFAGTLATAEITSDMEGELPPAFQNNGQPDWPKFWVRVNDELGLTEKQAHELLGMDSLKESIERGWTLEDIWNELVKRLRERKTPEEDIRQAPTINELKEIRQATDEAIARRESLASDEWPEAISEEPAELFDDSMVENSIDMNWLRESLEALGWFNVGKWLRDKYKNAYGATIKAKVESLTREQQEEFVAEVQKRLGAKTC